MLPIAILAGGLGTRLGALGAGRPKALVPVCGRPFIDHQLALLRRNGITTAVLCVSHLSEMIERHVGDGRAYDMQVIYAYDGPTRVGTAGALARALPQLGERFFVTYGDSYLDCDYAAIETAFLTSQKTALMTVYENAGRFVPSNVLARDGRIDAYDKADPRPDMRHVDYGLSLFHAHAFAGTPTNRPVDLAEIFQTLLHAGDLAGYSIPTRFYEVGTPEGIADTEAYLRETGRA